MNPEAIGTLCDHRAACAKPSGEPRARLRLPLRKLLTLLHVSKASALLDELDNLTAGSRLRQSIDGNLRHKIPGDLSRQQRVLLADHRGRLGCLVLEAAWSQDRIVKA